MTEQELEAIALDIGPVPGCFKTCFRQAPHQPMARTVYWDCRPGTTLIGNWSFDTRETDGKSEAEVREMMQARHNQLMCDMIELVAVNWGPKSGD